MSTPEQDELLSFALKPGGHHPSVFDYAGDGQCPVRRIPGSKQQAAKLYVLNDWKSVVQALKSSKIRSLRQVDTDHAVGGVTLQHPDGLLRRDPPHTDVRRTINPLFSAIATEPWRPLMREVSLKHANRISLIEGEFDLAIEYCRPVIADIVTAATGIERDEFEQFSDLSDRTTGRLVSQSEQHGEIQQAWSDLYDFCADQINRIRRRRVEGKPARSITAKVVNALDDLGMSEDEVLRAATTVYNGFPTVVPAFNVCAQQILLHHDVLEQHRHDDDLWPRVVRELLRHRAHFSFGLPGKALEDLKINDTVIPAGSTVLPAIHAAEHDPSRTSNPDQFDITRDSSSLVAFGMGVHVCPGKAFAMVLLEEGLRALTEVSPGLHLTVPTDAIEWQVGTMPSPKNIPVSN